MAAGKELFKLFGLIGMQGVENVDKQLKGIERQTRKVQKEIDRMGRKVQDVGKTLTKAFTIPMIAAAAAASKAVNDATDLNETISKTQVIFGNSEKSIRKWAETSSTALGQSEQQALDAASTFAIFGKSAGLADKELVAFSSSMVELSSDLASFFNTEPAEAITAIGAAFRGETEPIRRYGVMLDDATMRQKALELGLISTTKNALKPQQKVLAAQALILEQTKDAQGDFARTSQGLANQKRILNAQLKDISATLGQLFIPAASSAVSIIAKLAKLVKTLINSWDNLDEQTKSTVKGFALILAAIGPVTIAVGKLIGFSKFLIPLLVTLKSGTIGWAAAMKTLSGSVLGTVGVIGALAGVVWYWYSQWDTLSSQVLTIWEKLKLGVVDMASKTIDVLGDMAIKAIDIFAKFGKVIPGMGDKLNSAKVSILKFRASMKMATMAQIRAVAVAAEQEQANDGLVESVKRAIESGKEMLGLTEDQTDAVQSQTSAIDAMGGTAQNVAQKRIDFEREIAEALNERIYNDLELLEMEYEEKIAKANELGADIFEVETLYSLKRIELEEKEAERVREIKEKEKKEEEDRLKRSLQLTGMFHSKMNRVVSNYADLRIKYLDKEEKEKIKSVRNSELTEEQKEERIAKIQEHAAKRRLQIERQNALYKKAAAIFSIGIDTASAVVEALPNIPLSIAIGALGLAEAATVAATPLPFFDGGLIQGSPEGVNAIVGERNQTEVVFPLESGISAIVDGLVNALSGLEIPAFAAQPAAAVTGGNPITLNIGVFSGDERSLKNLERRLETVRINENIRKGF